MAYLGTKIDGDYEITEYTAGGTVRRRIDSRIVAEFTNYWTEDGSTHPTTQTEIDHIEDKLGIKI